MNKMITGAAISILALASQAALAQFSITGGVDFVRGDYGTATDADTITYPVILKYETGPWTLKANFAYVNTEANRDTGQATGPKQNGLGDTVISGFYNLMDANKAGFGLDVGLKAKLVTADKDKCLITTGNEDYSLQADMYKGFGGFTLFGSLGWTMKGDIECQGISTNPKDPVYASIGGAFKLSDATSLGAAYDYREKLFSNSKEVSEATLFVSHKFSKNWKAQLYGLTGFSDNSPDWGLGATLGYTF